MLSNYPPVEQIARAQRWQAQHHDWSIVSVDGGSHFIAEQEIASGAHIITRPSLKELMDRLEDKGSA